MNTPIIRSCFDAALLDFLPDLQLKKTQVAWFNTNFSPNVKELYIKPVLLMSGTQTVSLGTNCFERMTGIYQVSIFAVKDQGSSAFEQIAARMVDLFRGGKRLVSSGLEIIIQTAYYGSPLEQDARVMLPVSIVWSCYVPRG